MTDPTSPQHDQPVEGSRSESYTRPDDGNLGGTNGSQPMPAPAPQPRRTT